METVDQHPKCSDIWSCPKPFGVELRCLWMFRKDQLSRIFWHGADGLWTFWTEPNVWRGLLFHLTCAFGKIVLLSRVNNSINSEKKWQCSHSAVSDSLWSFWLCVAARLLHPWDFPGKNTRVVITIQWASSIRLIHTWMQPGREAEAHGSRMICPRSLSVCCPQNRNKVYSLSVFNLKNVPLNYPNTSELISFHYLFTNLLLCTE